MKNIRVLVVDDVEANRVSVQYLINEYLDDVDLFLAENGEDALKLTYTNEIDIIILDIKMPGLDGFDTAKYLKSNPKTQNIPIIFLTAEFKEEEFRQKGFEVGAIDYLTKPIDNLQFINKLKLYIEVIIKTKQLEAVNNSLYDALQKERELNEKIQKYQLELVDQSKMAALGEMIGNIAHQWRQPLSVISTGVTGIQLNMELGLSNNEENLESIKRIVDVTKELSNTIETFRDFTHSDKQLIEFDLSETINKCFDIEASLIEQNHINVVRDLQEDVKIVSLPNSLLQALVNIVKNAKEALDGKDYEKNIFVTSYIKEDKAIIKIRDNAGGIKTEFLNKIFEPYFTTKHQAHGVGLGLNIVYKIVYDSLYGKIKVRNSQFTHESKSYEGAEFMISVPLKL